MAAAESGERHAPAASAFFFFQRSEFNKEKKTGLKQQ
jgi:hypothetical protein